ARVVVLRSGLLLGGALRRYGCHGPPILPTQRPRLTGRPRGGTAVRGCVHLTNRGRRTALFRRLFQALYLLFRTTIRTVAMTSEPSAGLPFSRICSCKKRACAPHGPLVAETVNTDPSR